METGTKFGTQRLLGSLLGTAHFLRIKHIDVNNKMPKYNCCVPGCNNSHRNKPANFKFYCIPKDPELRQKYVVILKNETLKIESPMTRVCADHWDGGVKLSRTHLPTLFPWSVQKPERRVITKYDKNVIDRFKRKRKIQDDAAAMDEVIVSTEDEPQHIPVQSETQTDLSLEQLSQLEEEVKALRSELESSYDKNQELLRELQEAKREIRKLNFQIKNPRFDIDIYKHNNKDIEFYTGFISYSMLLTCYSLIENQTSTLNYGDKSTRDNSPARIGRPRLLSKFQEFVMVLMRLRLV